MSDGWEFDGDLDLSRLRLGLTKLPKISKVGGNFYYFDKNLESLEGCPQNVKEDCAIGYRPPSVALESKIGKMVEHNRGLGFVKDYIVKKTNKYEVIYFKIISLDANFIWVREKNIKFL